MKIKIGTLVEDDLYQQLKMEATHERRAINEVIEAALSDYLMRKRSRTPHRSGLERFLSSPSFNLTREQMRETMDADFYDQ